MQRFVSEFLNGRDADALDALMAADFVCHVAGVSSEPSEGRGAWRRRAAALRTAFPDFHLGIEDLIAERDRVVLRYRGSGTHLGPFGGSAPTRRAVTYTGIMVFRLHGGKLAEEWTEYDGVGLLRQVGALPSPAKS